MRVRPGKIIFLILLLAVLGFLVKARVNVESSPAVYETPEPTEAPLPEAEPEPEAVPEEVQTEEIAPEETPEEAEELPEPEPEPEPELDMSPLPPEFFNDAVFVGDSVSGTLQYQAYNSDDLGDSVFLCLSSYSVHAALDNSMMMTYRGHKNSLEKVLASYQAGKVFFMLGMNDISVCGVEETIENWGTLLERIRTENPGIRIFIQSCTPICTVGEHAGVTNENMDRYNELLKEFAAENDCTFISIAYLFKDETGALKPEYSRDNYVHLKVDCGKMWADAVRDPANYSVYPTR